MGHGAIDLKGEQILIVDDVETNRLVLEEIIKDMGCSPVLAENGEQALQMAKEMLYHGQVLAVLDLEVQGNLLLMQLKWQLKLLQRQLWYMD